MDVVREIISSDNSESSDIEAIEYDDFSSSSSCRIDEETDQREESETSENAGRNDISTTRKKAQSLLRVLKYPQP